MDRTPGEPQRSLTWATGLFATRSLALEGRQVVVRDWRFGRAAGQHTFPVEKLDPTPVPHQRRNRLLMALLVFSLFMAVVKTIDWSTRRLVATPIAWMVALAWFTLTWAIALHYVRTCGRFLAWSWIVSRRTAFEIPAGIAEGLDISAFLRIPTLPPPHGAAVIGTTEDRSHQLDDLLKKGHISDEEYRILKRSAGADGHGFRF